jgi:hypothetical protein
VWERERGRALINFFIFLKDNDLPPRLVEKEKKGSLSSLFDLESS